jgi:hypothetical protein
MNTVLERFLTPRMVSNYYDKPILLSPLFLLLTVVYGMTWLEIFRRFHGWKTLTLVLALFTSVWVHLIIQHFWFRSGDTQTLKTYAAKTTLAFSVLYVVTVGILLSFIR